MVELKKKIEHVRYYMFLVTYMIFTIFYYT
jgi:hypothetical protein